LTAGEHIIGRRDGTLQKMTVVQAGLATVSSERLAAVMNCLGVQTCLAWQPVIKDKSVPASTIHNKHPDVLEPGFIEDCKERQQADPAPP
jgi:hypothetical protein